MRSGATGPHTDPLVAPGTRGGGGTGARGYCRVCGCSFRLKDSSFRRLSGVGRPQAAPLHLRGAVLALLRLGDRRLGGRRPRGAVTPAPGFRDCARVGDAEGADPMAFALRGGAGRKGFPILLPHAGGEGQPPPSSEHSFLPSLCWRSRQLVPPALAADLVGIVRLC